MHLIETSPLSAEDGSSMVEVIVGMAMGMVVLAGLSMLLIVTMHGNARVSARAEASDNARVTMTRIMEELHSACVNPTVAPVQAGSTNTTLKFKHGTYGQQAAANEPPTTTTISYSGGQLWQTDEPEGGTRTQRLLLSNVSLPKRNKVFEYKNPTIPGQGIEPNELTESTPSETILVRVAFKASPKSEPVADAGAATEIENSATLRLTPPTYEEGKVAKPCE